MHEYLLVDLSRIDQDIHGCQVAMKHTPRMAVTETAEYLEQDAHSIASVDG